MERFNDENSQRRALAAAHRLVARRGWDDLVFTLLSARVPEQPDHLIVTPFPSMCSEATASNLVKVDLDGRPLDGGRIDDGGFPLYGAIHKARPDVNCILHLHTIPGVAVSARKEGLLPLAQTSMLIIEDLAYADYEGIGQGDERVVEALGQKNNLLLRNHGTISVGRSVPEAFGRLHVLESACAIQVAAMRGDGDSAITPVDRHVVSSVAKMGNEYLASGVLEDAWESMVTSLDREEPSYAE